MKLLNERSITEFAWMCTLYHACKIYDRKGYWHMTWILQIIVYHATKKQPPHLWIKHGTKAKHLIGSESQFWSPFISTFNELDFVHTVMKLFHLYLIKNQLAYKYKKSWKIKHLVLVWGEALSRCTVSSLKCIKESFKDNLKEQYALKYGDSVIISVWVIWIEQ